MKVTIGKKQLDKHNACSGGRAAFASVFGEKAKSVEWTMSKQISLYGTEIGPYMGWVRDTRLLPLFDMRYADFRGILIRHGSDFNYERLYGTNFSGMSLFGIHFAHALLYGSTFAGATISGGRFSYACMTTASLARVTATNSEFIGTDLRNARLDGGTFTRCNFRESVFHRNTTFTDATFIDCKHSNQPELLAAITASDNRRRAAEERRQAEARARAEEERATRAEQARLAEERAQAERAQVAQPAEQSTEQPAPKRKTRRKVKKTEEAVAA